MTNKNGQSVTDEHFWIIILLRKQAVFHAILYKEILWQEEDWTALTRKKKRLRKQAVFHAILYKEILWQEEESGWHWKNPPVFTPISG